jgi:hypothetical protein
MRSRTFAVFLLLASGCGDSPTTPENQPSRLVVTAVSPSSGGTVVVPAQYPFNPIGGVVLPPQSGLISVTVSIRSAHEVPWAQLYVYLRSGTDYCGQNLPDAPTWGFLPSGWTTTYAVTGFQVYNLPCDVTGVQAFFHTRNNGLLIPPTPAETIAEATAPASFHLRR